MFGFIKNWFGRKKQQTVKVEEYPERERLIFRYRDGNKWVNADPLVLYKRLMEIGPELNLDIEVSKSIHPDAHKAHTELVKKIRKIFQLPDPQNGLDCSNTLSEVETAALLGDFLLYCHDLKKNWSPTTTTAEAILAPIVSGSDANPPIQNGSVSGSTANAACID